MGGMSNIINFFSRKAAAPKAVNPDLAAFLQGFSIEVVDHIEGAEPVAGEQRVAHKIH